MPILNVHKNRGMKNHTINDVMSSPNDYSEAVRDDLVFKIAGYKQMDIRRILSADNVTGSPLDEHGIYDDVTASYNNAIREGKLKNWKSTSYDMTLGGSPIAPEEFQDFDHAYLITIPAQSNDIIRIRLSVNGDASPNSIPVTLSNPLLDDFHITDLGFQTMMFYIHDVDVTSGLVDISIIIPGLDTSEQEFYLFYGNEGWQNKTMIAPSREFVQSGAVEGDTVASYDMMYVTAEGRILNRAGFQTSVTAGDAVIEPQESFPPVPEPPAPYVYGGTTHTVHATSGTADYTNMADVMTALGDGSIVDGDIIDVQDAQTLTESWTISKNIEISGVGSISGAYTITIGTGKNVSLNVDISVSRMDINGGTLFINGGNITLTNDIRFLGLNSSFILNDGVIISSNTTGLYCYRSNCNAWLNGGSITANTYSVLIRYDSANNSVILNGTTLIKSGETYGTITGGLIDNESFVYILDSPNEISGLGAGLIVYIYNNIDVSGWTITSTVYVATTPGDVVGSGVAGDGTNFKQIYGQYLSTVYASGTHYTYTYDGTDLSEDDTDYVGTDGSSNITIGAITSESEATLYYAFIIDTQLSAPQIAQIQADFESTPSVPALSNEVYPFKATDFNGVDQYATTAYTFGTEGSIIIRWVDIDTIDTDEHVLISDYVDASNYVAVYYADSTLYVKSNVSGTPTTDSVAFTKGVMQLTVLEWDAVNGITLRNSALGSGAFLTANIAGATMPEGGLFMASLEGLTLFSRMVMIRTLALDRLLTSAELDIYRQHNLEGTFAYYPVIEGNRQILAYNGGAMTSDDNYKQAIAFSGTPADIYNPDAIAMSDSQSQLFALFKPDPVNAQTVFKKSDSSGTVIELTYTAGTLTATVTDTEGDKTASLTSMSERWIAAHVIIKDDSLLLYASDGLKSGIASATLATRYINADAPVIIGDMSGRLADLIIWDGIGNDVMDCDIIVNNIHNYVGWV